MKAARADTRATIIGKHARIAMANRTAAMVVEQAIAAGGNRMIPA